MERFSFVHTADLHLDSPFAGLKEVDERVARLLQSATFKAFENIVSLCIERNVDFLLVAGDVYDGADRSLRAQLRFRDSLLRLSDAGIKTFVVHGNHDPMDGWSATLKWPDHVYIFRETIESVPVQREKKKIAQVYGVSYPQRDLYENLAAHFRKEGEAPFHIGLLHCNVGTETGHKPYAPCSMEDLLSAGMDYWALGHVHRKTILSHKQPTIIYPGTPQGLNPNETGPHGCYVVEVERDGGISVEFVPVDEVRWVTHEVNISNIKDHDHLLAFLEETSHRIQSQARKRNVILRLALTGRGFVHHSLKRPGFIDDLTSRLREIHAHDDPLIWIERIEPRTRPEVDIAARRQAEDFIGEFLRVSQNLKEDDRLWPMLREELSELISSRRGLRFLKMPDDEELINLIEEAEVRGLDLLLGGSMK
nr:DNA repair exonuclease [Desulfobacterales bacterium]